MYDVIVIGGGPAGLQAALTLARVHRSVLVLDSEAYRNAPAAHMHNFITHDGTPPSEFRERARLDLAAYDTVDLRKGEAVAAHAEGPSYVIGTADGDRQRARRLVLATGVRDVLPEVPGMAELWGDLVHHCPFCHGHELAGQRVGVQDGPHAERLVAMLGPIAGSVSVLEGISGVARHGTALRVRTAGGEVVVDGLFAATSIEQASPLVSDLELALLPSGCVEVDAFGRTSRPGVFAAGDLAHVAALPMPMASVLTAAAAGLVAGSAAHQDLL